MNGCHIKPEQFFNLIFGYYDRYFEPGSDLNPGAGAIVKTLTAVPDNEIWVLQAAAGHNDNRGTLIYISVGDGTNYARIANATTPSAGVACLFEGSVVMKPGDRVQVIFWGTTAGDDLYWRAWGYKMKLVQ